MMGYLCLCPPAVCRPSALTYSCRPRSSDADNLRILLSNSYRACSQENDKYDFDPQEDLIDQLHLDMGRIYATLRSSHTVWLPPGDGELRPDRRPHGRVFLCERILQMRQAGGAPVSTWRSTSDGGDSPHEPRLHWSTCASTRRTMSPASRLVGAVHEPVLANPVREPAVHRRFARLGSFTVHGSRRVSREESVHGSRFTDLGSGLVGSRFAVRPFVLPRFGFTVQSSRSVRG